MTRTTRRAIWCLVVLGFGLRFALRLSTGAADFWVNGYGLLFELARSAAAGHGLTLDGVTATAFRMPLYPLFLAAVTLGREAFLPVVATQSLIGAATIWCAGLLAMELIGPAAAVLAAAITAVYPYYVVHDTALQDTSLFTLLTLASVTLLLRARRSESGVAAFGAGLLLGAAVLTRASIVPFAVGAPILLALVHGSMDAGAWRIRLRTGVLCAGATGLMVSPWLVRSYRLTGVPVLSTETGLELWNGNNPLTFSHYPRESSDLSKAAALDALTLAEHREISNAGDNEAAIDRWFFRRGAAYIRNHPGLTITNGFRKIVAAFGWLPSPRRSFWPTLVYALSYGPVMLLGLWGVWLRRRRWREDAIVYLVFVSFGAVTAVFFGHTSHRAYLDVYCIVFAAGVWAVPKRPARSSEAQLLLLCAHARPVEGDRVRDLARKGLDWDALADAAEYHGLAPILHRTLEGTCDSLVPEHVASRLRGCYRDSATRNMIFTVQLFALLDAFEAEGIAVLSLKGPVLAEALYPDPVLRPFSDLDLLVRKRDVPAAMRVLKQEGYTLAAHLARLPLNILLKLHFELLFRQKRMAQVDLQWESALADYPFRFDTEILWRSLGRTRIGEREVPSLSPETLLLFLCVHGAKHLWSRLQWLGDVARLASAQPDWNLALELADEAGCMRPLLLGLRLAHELLDAPVPEAILERAHAIETIEPLASQVLSRLHRVPAAEPESLELTTFNMRLAEGTWKKARHYAAMLNAPTEEELELVVLPVGLFFLYYPVRAVRLMLKYITRVVSR